MPESPPSDYRELLELLSHVVGEWEHSFFPIVVNVATGLATMEPELEDVLRALGAKKIDNMLKVGIPRSQPYLFGSLKVAITLAFVGTVVSRRSPPMPASAF